MARSELSVTEIMALLPETPRRLASLTRGLSEAELRTVPAPDAWSVGYVLAHLRASHDVLGGSMLRILAEERPQWRRLSPRAWMRRTDYAEWDFASGFEAFRRQRAELLEVLEPLPPESWQRVAVVTAESGTVSERTVRFYGDWMAAHEVEHLAQIGDIIAAIRPQA